MMESPAKGDTRQGLKASQKHLEFQLQREKAYTRELEDKLKAQQFHIAKLEQDKAELRRELITLTDDEKKKSKLEEKCHGLQKELAEKQAALVAEQRRVTAAEYEKEQIRRDAHASIAKWCEAEKQWVAENEILQKELDESKVEFAKLRAEYESLGKVCDDISGQLQCEKEHCLRLESSAEATEKKMASLHARIETLLNDICMRDETVFKLDEAGSKWQEICNSKDDEIKTLEMQNQKFLETIEKLQACNSTLNQRIEASKVLTMEEKGRLEKILCDLRDSEKEKKLIQMELDAAKRDFEHVSQNYLKHQELVTDLRAKLTTTMDQLKEKSSEARKQELIVSQLTADLKQVERELSNANHLITAQESQIKNFLDALEESKLAKKTIQDENSLLKAELQQMKVSYEMKDETVVLMKSELEDRIEGLLMDVKRFESEVDERQQMINNLMKQLGDANTKNEELHAEVLREYEASSQLRGFCKMLQQEGNEICFGQFVCEEKNYRYELYEQFLEEMVNMFLQHFAVTRNFLSHCFDEKCRLNSVLCELDAEKAMKINQLDAIRVKLEERVRLLEDDQAKQASEIGVRNMEFAELQEVAREHEKALALLREELQVQQNRFDGFQNAEKYASDKLNETMHLLHQTSAELKKQTHLLNNAMMQFDEEAQLLISHSELYITWVIEKTNIVFSSFNYIYTENTEKVLNAFNSLKSVQEKAEERAAHLSLILKDTETRLREQEEALVKQAESFAMKIRFADNKQSILEEEKEKCIRNHAALMEQLKTDIDTKNGKIKELLIHLDNEKCNRQAVDAKLQKLRKKLDYELARKEDYKKALEEVKLRREEVERYRATEKEWALKAISRANEEVNYWVTSFEKLKAMLDELSYRSGTKVCAVDQATINKFEETRRRLGLRDQEVNTVSSEKGDCNSEKRIRIE